jgi:hypothetical protein
MKRDTMQMKNLFLLLLILGIMGTSLFINQNVGGVDISQITNFKPLESPVILGKTDYGYVERGGPYGNTSSPVKVAYITGVHPLEFDAHDAILEAVINNDNSLKYCYYIYKVHVTQDAADYNKGRINGQKLAYNYVVPDIKSHKFDLAVDVHSNRGVYKDKIFVDVPANDKISRKYAFEIAEKISWLTFYVPPPEKGPTSGAYVTLPLINSGIPTFVYETYMYEPYNITLEHAVEFVQNLDKISIK